MLALPLVLGVSACGASGSGRSSRPERPATRRSPYLIDADELRASNALNLYDAVRTQRPSWLTRTVRNATGNDAVAVYLDERFIGSLSILREMPIDVARRLQYLAPTEAQMRFGITHGHRAAIVVESAKR